MDAVNPNIPGDDVGVPLIVRKLARGAELTPVWRNNLGGLTFRSDDGRYLKHGPRNGETSFAAETARLEWAARYTPVPRVLEHGGDAAHEWMVTAALPGESAVARRWVAEPAVAAEPVMASPQRTPDRAI